ncbi:Gfo/Idh/MocA family protein [Vulcanisaeta thermophila]|uniref:Gfo/Idh/MocA family protein n=1 Tax=Vulcanisaeta thermophila TaxID=867917 RepID=UPI000853BFAC|nr:Gfo/Idh/MocA family oxidoreductase [Vulcanisaeta thermophila]
MKVLIVGVGRMGQNHIKTLLELKRENLVSAIYAHDVDPAKLEQARRMGVDAVFPRLIDAINQRPDLGIVAVPTQYHYRVSLELIKYMDLLIEKPITDNLNDALSLYNEARRQGRVVMVGHVERFNPTYVSLSSELRGKDAIYLETIRIGKPAGDLASYGNVLVDLAIHDVDLALDIVKPDVVSIDHARLLNQPVTTALSIMSFDDVPVVDYVSWDYDNRVRTLKVVTTRDYYEADLLNNYMVHGESRSKVQGMEPLKRELLHAIKVVKGIEKPIVGIEEGIRALAVIDGIMRGVRKIELNALFGL